jgi:hypothetical protein
MSDIRIKVCEHTCNPEAGTPQSRLEILKNYVAGDPRYDIIGVRCLGGCMLGHTVKITHGEDHVLFVDKTYGLDSIFTKHPENATDMIDDLYSYLKRNP